MAEEEVEVVVELRSEVAFAATVAVVPPPTRIVTDADVVAVVSVPLELAVAIMLAESDMLSRTEVSVGTMIVVV